MAVGSSHGIWHLKMLWSSGTTGKHLGNIQNLWEHTSLFHLPATITHSPLHMKLMYSHSWKLPFLMFHCTVWFEVEWTNCCSYMYYLIYHGPDLQGFVWYPKWFQVPLKVSLRNWIRLYIKVLLCFNHESECHMNAIKYKYFMKVIVREVCDIIRFLLWYHILFFF